MTELALAVRLCLAGGPLRALLVIAGSAAGVAVLLLATAIPGTLPDGLSADDRRFAVCVVLFLLLPVVSLLASTTRLAAAVRDRRLASLRLLGMTATRTRLVAGYEATALALAGAIAGAVAFLALRPLLQAADDAWRDWFGGRPLAPPITGWLLALVGVPLLALVVSVAPVQRSTRTALNARRQGPARRPGWWRLLPLATGIAMLAWTALQDLSPDGGPPQRLILAFFVGAALTGLSLPLVVPVVVRLVADAGIRLLRSPASLIAARRLQQEPAGTSRLVAALLVALFVVAGGRCVLVAFEQTPQYLRAQRAATTGPQLAQLNLAPGQALDVEQIRSTPGVRAVAAVRQVEVVCSAELDGALDALDAGGSGFCGEAFVGTCAELAAFAAHTTGCRDDRPAWLDPGYDTGMDPGATSVTVRPATTYGPDGQELPATDAALEVTGLGTVSVRPDTRDPNWTLQQQLFLPAATPGLAALLPAPRTWAVVLDGGKQPVQRLERAAGPGVDVYAGLDGEDLRTVDGYRALLWAVAGVVLSVGLAALLIAGVDRAVERRQHLAALTVLGVPARVIRRSQLLQAAAPLIVGLPVAGGTALLAGAAYLNLVGSRAVTPWPAVTALVLGAIVAGLIVAAATVAGLGGRVQASDLRQT